MSCDTNTPLNIKSRVLLENLIVRTGSQRFIPIFTKALMVYLFYRILLPMFFFSSYRISHPCFEFTEGFYVDFLTTQRYQRSFASFVTLRVLSCLHLPGFRDSCCSGHLTNLYALDSHTPYSLTLSRSLRPINHYVNEWGPLISGEVGACVVFHCCWPGNYS